LNGVQIDIIVLNGVQLFSDRFMVRRSDHSRDELAGLVIEAARAIIAQEGARGVTMRRIAAQIGYAAGSIYNAVGDIDAVLLRVNAGTLAGLVAKLETAIGRAGALADAVALALLIAETYMGYVATNTRLWAALLERPPAPDSLVPEWYAAPRARLVEIVASVLAPLYPDIAARRRAVVALWAAMQGVASLASGGNLAFAASGLDPGDIARSIVLRYLTGLEERPRHGEP
jgi:AcrR family transcriptional regulator